MSYNEFVDHDKVMLIGSSNSRFTDRGTLRVTLHHNLFENTGQRTPRVRFGQVDVYNNYYVQPEGDDFVYHWGVGVESQIYAENNYFELGPDVPPADVIVDWDGTMIEALGTYVNGRSRRSQVDLVAVYNAEHEPDLRPTVDWEPTLRERVHPTQAVVPIVSALAGSGVID